MRDQRKNREILCQEATSLVNDIESFPAVMYLETQRGCPYDCIMCTVPKSYGRKPTEMPEELLQKLTPYFKYLELIAIHGNGEALLSKKIDTYIDIANDNDCYLHCNSTGFPLTNKLSDKLVEAKLDIRFSIHAGTSDTYRRVMNDDLNRVIKKIGYLLDKSRQRGRPENSFWFSCIVMKDNVEELDKFLDLAHSVGITEVRFMNLHPNHRTIFGTRRNKNEERFIHIEQANGSVNARFNQLLPELREKAAQLGIHVGSGSMNHAATVNAGLREVTNKISYKLTGQNMFPIMPIRGSCLAPWTGQVQIEQNGDVGLCCAVKHTVGNLYQSSFQEIWHGDEMNSLRKTFGEGRQPKVCGYCRGIGTSEYAIPINKMIEAKQNTQQVEIQSRLKGALD